MLQTWQTTLWLRRTQRMLCSSHMPSSRRRWQTSGEASSCLMRTEVPARTLLKGQHGNRSSTGGH